MRQGSWYISFILPLEGGVGWARHPFFLEIMYEPRFIQSKKAGGGCSGHYQIIIVQSGESHL